MEHYKKPLFKHLLNIFKGLEDLQEFLQTSLVLVDSFLEKPGKLERFLEAKEKLQFDGAKNVLDPSGKFWITNTVGGFFLQGDSADSVLVDMAIESLFSIKMKHESKGLKNIRLYPANRGFMDVCAHRLETDEEYENRIKRQQKKEEVIKEIERREKEKRYQRYLQLKAEFEKEQEKEHPLFPGELRK